MGVSGGSKRKHPKSKRNWRNDDRPNGKAWKQGKSPAERGLKIRPAGWRKKATKDAIEKIHKAA